MSRTFQGASLLKGPRINYNINLHRSVMPARSLDLNSMRGEVHRFEGVVDRIGKAPQATGVIETICIRDIIHCRTNQRITPDHWWFRMRQEWMEARLMTGDLIVFEAKVQRCSKGSSAPGTKEQNERRQVIGFGSTVRSVIVKQHAATAGRQHSFRQNSCSKMSYHEGSRSASLELMAPSLSSATFGRNRVFESTLQARS